MTRLKSSWWWLSDPTWRRKYRANQQRIKCFRNKQRLAMAKLLRFGGNKIIAGPFAGMKFMPAQKPNSYCAQVLLGTYELELHGAVEEICRTGYGHVIDVGASEGYYACGFKLRMPRSRVTAFEMDQDKHAVLAELFRENGVEGGLEIRGACSAGALQLLMAAGAERVLVFCDIDGGEVDVLDPSLVPDLAYADLLVETHDAIRPRVTEILMSRFSATHVVKLIPEQRRTLADAPSATPLCDDELLGAMDEFRGTPQAWLWMAARNQRK